MPTQGVELSCILAESKAGYRLNSLKASPWIDVLVDCPGAQGLYTYRLPIGMQVQPGDVLSVTFGQQQVGAIAVRTIDQPPLDLDIDQIRDVTAIIHPGFFSPTYWKVLNRVAEYYCTSLMQVVRVALPPGLLARSQRRVRLVSKPDETDRVKAVGNKQDKESSSPLPTPHSLLPLDSPAHHLLTLLQSSKTGDYSWQYLQRQVPNAYRGLEELLKLGLAVSYLEPPTPVRPKQRQAVTLVSSVPLTLSARQQEILSVLQRQGGEVWLAELLQLCQTSSATLKTLAQKGYLVIQPREVLRCEADTILAADRPKTLTPEQAIALAQLRNLSGFVQVLLHGVTGSGKTEVYLQAIAPVLQRGESVLVLVPEIGLTPQLTDRFRARFGSKVCVYHSALSEGERYDTWRQMLGGDTQVVIGTRSAIFAPLPKLGLIVLDEEHDSSFKQDQPAPCYHAGTVARWRAELEECPLILGSATPSLESWVRAGKDEGRKDKGLRIKDKDTAASANSVYLSLPNRIQARPLPPIDVVDMRQELLQGNLSIFSRSLKLALERIQEQNQQAILFIHRRGHSTFVSCRSCGYVVACPHCDVSLAYHHTHAEATPRLRCHYCNYAQLVPKACPACESTYFKHFGSGTQRVSQELTQLFPNLRLLRFDSDTTRAKGAHRAILTQFARGEADVLVGTQMLTKGIDLPQVTLVGIIAADGLLHFADYRASERTFQTLTQVAGRCGRGETAGRVVLQTYSPEHPVIQAVKRYDYTAFVGDELEQRATLNYPPYGRLILLRFSSTNPVAVQKAAERVAHALGHLLGVTQLGPAPAAVLRVANRYRWQLLLKLPADSTATLPLSDLRALCPSSVSLTVDVDPLNL